LPCGMSGRENKLRPLILHTHFKRYSDSDIAEVLLNRRNSGEQLCAEVGREIWGVLAISTISAAKIILSHNHNNDHKQVLLVHMSLRTEARWQYEGGTRRAVCEHESAGPQPESSKPFGCVVEFWYNLGPVVVLIKTVINSSIYCLSYSATLCSRRVFSRS
jgi:hypothetical protein